MAKIIYLEDDARFAARVCEILAAHGHDVLVFDQWQLTKRELLKGDTDVLMLDYELPHPDDPAGTTSNAMPYYHEIRVDLDAQRSDAAAAADPKKSFATLPILAITGVSWTFIQEFHEMGAINAMDFSDRNLFILRKQYRTVMELAAKGAYPFSDVQGMMLGAFWDFLHNGFSALQPEGPARHYSRHIKLDGNMEDDLPRVITRLINNRGPSPNLRLRAPNPS